MRPARRKSTGLCATTLAFQSVLIIDPFGELADPEFLVFHQLEADATAFGQALRGEAQADLMDLFAGNQDRASPLSLNLYGIFIWSSAAMMAPPSRSPMFENRTGSRIA